MTTPAIGRGRHLGLAALTGILILTDGAFTGLGLMIWNAHQADHLTSREAATFTLLGASAAAGAVVMLLALIALTRGSRGHQLAQIASGLAWLRVAGVVLALMVITGLLGVSAAAGLLQTAGAAVAVFEAVLAVYVTGVATRRTARR